MPQHKIGFKTFKIWNYLLCVLSRFFSECLERRKELTALKLGGWAEGENSGRSIKLIIALCF
jgi:hypothetical protein